MPPCAPTEDRGSEQAKEVISGQALRHKQAAAQNPNPKPSLRPFHHLGGPLDLGDDVLQDAADDLNLLSGLVPVALFDGLADAGERLDAVASVETRCVDVMPEPIS